MKEGILTNPWLVWGLMALALIGAGTVLYGLWRGVRRLWWKAAARWVIPRLQRRHQTACDALNKVWRTRIVRHAATGRVGLVRGVCVLDKHRYRDLLWPRWTADVVVMPAIARLMMKPPEAEPGMFPAIFIVCPPEGAIERIALKELTLAPSGEAAVFREAMEAQPEL
jgi:hypothetical protein